MFGIVYIIMWSGTGKIEEVYTVKYSADEKCKELNSKLPFIHKFFSNKYIVEAHNVIRG